MCVVLTEVQDFRRGTDWFWGPNALPRYMDDSLPRGSSTCAASKAVGWTNGISKNSNISVVNASMSLADNTWAFAKVLDDVLAKKLQGKSVILFPRAFKRGTTLAQPPQWAPIRRIMEDLIAADVNIVTCAGDTDIAPKSQSPLSIPDRAPAMWSSHDFPQLSLERSTTTEISLNSLRA